MASYVVDASVVIQRLIGQPFTINAKALFDHAAEGNLVVPECCLLECAQIIEQQVRTYGMPPAQAQRMIHDLRALPLTCASTRKLLDDAVQIGLRHQLNLYAAVYLVLAAYLGFPLITLDSRQGQAAQVEGIPLKPITDFNP